MPRNFRILPIMALAGLFIAGAGFFLLPWFAMQMDIDRCLDAGGRWDHVGEKCDTAEIP